MNILLIGSGGREHALACALSSSASCSALYCTPGNAGIAHSAILVSVDVTNHQDVITFCEEKEIGLVVIGPEQPLADGLSDSLRIAGFPVFGPSKAASELETSKGFAKDFMGRYNIPTAQYQRFDSSQRDEAHMYIQEHQLPVVVKADGLAAGKGVIIARTRVDAMNAINDIFDGAFGSAGEEIVIEDFLEGEEASVFAICDGTSFVTLAPAQDYKRIFDGDTGKNTGGMGSYAPANIVTEEVMNQVKNTIIAPLLEGMQHENKPFFGCLFVGLMIHNGFANVVEFNVRFGDPETQSILSILDADVAKLFYSAAMGSVDATAIRSVATRYACTVVLASKGYPDEFNKGVEIRGLAEAGKLAHVYYAGVKVVDGVLLTNAGRVLGITAVSESLSQAIERAYQAVEYIDYSTKYYRKDIGKKGLQYEDVSSISEHSRL